MNAKMKWYAQRLRLLVLVALAGAVVASAFLVLARKPQPVPALEASYATAYFDSSFGFHPAGVYRQGYSDNGFVDAQNIGVRWHRPPVYAFWFLIQPDLNQPVYDFSLYDQQWGAVPEGMNILANITVGPESEGYSLPGSYLPVDTTAYQDFVRATVERYDGDGVDDMPGLTVPIHYWQVDNEPGFGLVVGRPDFAQLQALTYTAIKDACAGCQVMIGGATGFPADFDNIFLTDYALILEALDGQYVDIFDFHWYGNATGDYRLLGQSLSVIQAKLQETGFGSIPIWVTEMGTYSGDPVDFPFGVLPYQSEEQQAADLLKRFVYPISLGIEKVFPAFGLIEGFKGDNGYFDHTGLIYDGEGFNDSGLGVKKVGYYTYKLMTEKLEGATFDYELAGLPANVYGYAFTGAGGDPITILWYDDFAGGPPTQDVTLPVASPAALVTDAVTDQQGNITSVEVPVSGGSVALTLGGSPVFVEEASSADSDGDGFTDAIELFVGTDPAAACPATPTSDDEDPDAWPPDTNDNQFVNVFDVVPYIAALNSVGPNPPYFARLDLNTSGNINVFDVVPFIQLLNKACLP